MVRLGVRQLDGSADRPLLDIWLHQLTSIVFFCKNIHGLLSIVAIQLRRCGLYIPYANLDEIDKLPQDRPSEQRRRYEMLNVEIAGRKTEGQLNVIQECNLHDLQLKSARGLRLSCLYGGLF